MQITLHRILLVGRFPINRWLFCEDAHPSLHWTEQPRILLAMWSGLPLWQARAIHARVPKTPDTRAGT
jgi:hypothetical protein